MAFPAGLSDRILDGKSLTREEGLSILKIEGPDLPRLLAEANAVRHHFFGSRVTLCSILNVKSGNCGEDCAFCAQSGRFHTGIPTYDLVDSGLIADYAKKARAWGSHVGLVTSGRNVLKGAEFERLLGDIRALAGRGIVDASLGILSAEQAGALKKAGVGTYNHNVETSRAFFSRIVTTHSYEDRVRTAQLIRENRMRLCCGGILGMGESLKDRVDMAFEIRELDPDVIPLNFLHPIPGTPLENAAPIPPLDALKAIALFRLVNPSKDIKICGGREYNLRELQSWIFFAGASGMMIGDYLTTKGRDVDADLKMIRDLGFTADGPA
jgi:biotin synthase